MANQRAKRFRRVRTPTVLQMEATECGAAALGIILAYHGRHVPLEELRVECRVSRDGSNALYIKKTAEKYGLTNRGYQMTVEELRELKPPFMVFWALNHFLVVEGFGRSSVYLSDPATGRRVVDEATFRALYTGIVFVFEPGPSFSKGGPRPDTWKAIARRMRGALGAVGFVVLAGVAVMACELVAATFNLVFVDQLLVEERRAWLRPLLLAMSLAAGFRVLAGVLQLGSLSRLKLGLAMTHSARFLWHVLRLPVSFYQQRYAGDVSGRVDGNSLVAELISGQLATTIVGLLVVVFYALVMIRFDPLLTAVGVAIGLLNLAAIAISGRFVSDENLKIKQVRGQLSGVMMRAVQIIETIKAGSWEDETLVRLTGYQARITNSSQLIGAASALLLVLPPFLLLATTVAVLGIGGYRVIDGAMSVGALVAFQTLMANFNRPFGDLVRLGSGVQALQAELARLDDVLQAPLDPIFDPATAAPVAPRGPVVAGAGVNGASGNDGASVATPATPPSRPSPRRLSGHLVLRDVTFGYQRTIDEPIIRKFSLEIQPGSRVALVGSSGSGKSTVGRLVAGLYRPWSGEILYDGYPIEEIPRRLFTDQVALVDDQTFLFTGSVRDNLTLWDETITDRDMTRSAIDAGIHRDLIRRRGAYSARLAEGARNLSGGQRQRLEIARALIRNPVLLVLDEATSALDPVTEAVVDDNLRRRGCSCLIIAHRLSTIRDCDEIIVLRQGRVIQRGTHDELMRNATGYYHELQTIQAGLDTTAQARDDSSDARRTRVALAPPAVNGSVPKSGAPETSPSFVVSQNATTGNGSSATDPSHPSDGPPAQSFKEGPALISDLLRELEPYETTVTAAGNQPLPLDDAGAVWRVTNGQVDVFYVQPPEPGQAQGRRRHLCRVEEGGFVFAIDGVRSREQGGLLAVGVGLAELRKFPLADLVRLGLEPAWRPGVADMIDDWVNRISRATDPGDPTPPAVALDPDDEEPISAGQCVSSRANVLWVRPSCRSFRFFGRVPVPDCPLGSRFPLSHHAWLTFEGAGTIRAWDTTTLMENGDPWLGLKRLHRVVLDAIAQERVRDSVLRDFRVEHSDLRDEQAVAAALAGLADTSSPRSSTSGAMTDEEALVEACREVGHAQRIEVKGLGPGEAEDPLSRIARTSGFRTRRVRLEGDWWKADSGPLLAFDAGDGRPLALLPAGESGYTLVDPVRGTRAPVDSALAESVSSSAVMFSRSLTSERPGVGDLLRFGLPAVRGELKTLLAMGVVSGLLGLLVPWLTAVAVDDAIPRADHQQLATVCGFLLALGLAIALFQTIQGVSLVRIKGRLESILLPAVWDRLLNLPTRFFAKEEAGDLALRAMGLSRVIDVLASTSVASLMLGTFSLSNVIVMFLLNWRLALIAVVLISVPALATLFALPSLWRCQRAIARSQGKISGLLLVLLGGVARLRVAGAERRAFARWAGMYELQLGLMRRFQWLSDRLILLSDVWPILIMMVVFASIIGLDSGMMTTGEFLGFNLAMMQGMAALMALARGLLPLLNGLEQYERFRPILEATPEVLEVGGETVTLGGAIRMEGVSFRYDSDGPLVLDDVSLQVRPGEFVAVVGPSGSGKSTLLRLLLGFETPTEGVVAYDGRELATLDVQEVRRQIGVVLQDAQLLPGDLFANIVGFSPLMTRKDAWQAADLAGFADDIEQMPMGIHTRVSEGGGGLSSGQRQRLMIARALASHPRILIFDEATSALDNRTQAVVSRNIQTRLQGATRLAIAHRLSTIADADRIYVLNEGKIVQTGRFSQLIREPGLFQDLARRQMID